jgi:tetratricopeptide (TPR) repeat protein
MNKEVTTRRAIGVSALVSATSFLFWPLMCAGRAWALPSAQPPLTPQRTIAGPATDNVEKARCLAESGKLAAAESRLRAFIVQNETSAEAHYTLAYVLFRENQPLPSLEEYTHAAHLQAPSAQQLKYVALDYVLANDFTDADKWMTQVIQWTPQDSDAWYSLGRIKYSENRFAESIGCFQKALALTPKLIKAENNMGLAFEGLNQTEQAVVAYRTAIAWQAGAVNPSEQPLINLGIILVDRNQNAEAVPLLEQAKQIAPSDPRIRLALGRLYLHLDRAADAQKEFERAVALEPQVAADHFQLGQAYRKAGLAEKAKVEFAQAEKLNGSHSSR